LNAARTGPAHFERQWFGGLAENVRRYCEGTPNFSGGLSPASTRTGGKALSCDLRNPGSPIARRVLHHEHEVDAWRQPGGKRAVLVRANVLANSVLRGRIRGSRWRKRIGRFQGSS